jgi:hypothetical protein
MRPSLLVLASTACSPQLSATLEVNERVPTVVSLSWTSPVAAQSWVEYGLDGELDQSTPLSDSCNTLHEVPVLGLKAGRSYSFRPVSLTPNGTRLEGKTRTLDLDAEPEGLPGFEITWPEPGQEEPGGFVLTSTLGVDNGWVVILDRDGDPVWFHKADGALSITTTLSGRDHKSILHSQYDVQQRTDVGGTVRMSLVDGESQLTPTHLAHHDFVELPDGQLAWIQLELGTAEIDGETAWVAGDRIVEAPEGSDPGEGHTIFSFLEDYTDPAPGCDHFYADAFGTGAYDWVHANSLMYDDNEGSYYLMSKNLDAVFKIDRSSGQLLWQLGGEESTLELVGEGRPFTHAHMSHRWGDHLLVFDNGYHQYPSRSRVVEYLVDEESGSYEQIWEYSDPSDRFVQLLGDARRLPGGNTLVSWSTAGLITEISPEGDLVWQAEAELGYSTGRVSWFQDLYRLE